MKYRKIGNNTFVLVPDDKAFGEFCQKLRESESSTMLSGGKAQAYNNPRAKDRTAEMQDFVKKTFRERDFISTTEMNVEIRKTFRTCATYYRKRMIALGLITEKNNTVKPVKKTDSPT